MDLEFWKSGKNNFMKKTGWKQNDVSFKQKNKQRLKQRRVINWENLIRTKKINFNMNRIQIYF